jgi:hypothetical protein
MEKTLPEKIWYHGAPSLKLNPQQQFKGRFPFCNTDGFIHLSRSFNVASRYGKVYSFQSKKDMKVRQITHENWLQEINLPEEHETVSLDALIISGEGQEGDFPVDQLCIINPKALQFLGVSEDPKNETWERTHPDHLFN